MNKGIEQAIQKLIEKLNSGIDWTAGQLPDIATQCLRYWWWKSLLASIGCFLVVCICAIVILKCIKPCQEFNKKDYEFRRERCNGFAVAILGSSATGVFFLANGVAWVFDFLQISIAPKLYLLEYLRKLI